MRRLTANPNLKFVNAAAKTLLYFRRYHAKVGPSEVDFKNNVMDLLTNLMHLCDAEHVNWNELVEAAKRQHHVETKGAKRCD